MDSSIENILALYDQEAPLEMAYTIPAAWYVDERIAHLENQQVFGGNWIAVGRTDQVATAGQFFTFDLAGEPLVIVRGTDNQTPRLFQRLPAPCGGRGHRAMRSGPTPTLPLPWLDLRSGRFAQRNTRVRAVFAILTAPRTGCCPCAWKPGRTLSL